MLRNVKCTATLPDQSLWSSVPCDDSVNRSCPASLDLCSAPPQAPSYKHPTVSCMLLSDSERSGSLPAAVRVPVKRTTT